MRPSWKKKSPSNLQHGSRLAIPSTLSPSIIPLLPSLARSSRLICADVTGQSVKVTYVHSYRTCFFGRAQRGERWHFSSFINSPPRAPPMNTTCHKNRTLQRLFASFHVPPPLHSASNVQLTDILVISSSPIRRPSTRDFLSFSDSGFDSGAAALQKQVAFELSLLF